MVIVFFGVMHHPDLQYSAASIREVKCARLAYGTRLSRLHTLNPPIGIDFSEEQSFSNIGPRA
jgi:hypothetical protein